MVRHCWRCAAVLPGVPPVTCARCGEVHYVNPRPCGCAVVVHDGAVLLLLRARDPEAGRWTLPGGFCEQDEHPMLATERELTEEVGLTGRATAYLGTWMDVYGPPADDGLVIHTAVSGYLVALEDPGARPRPDPAEAREVRWFALGALPRALAFPAHIRPMIAAASDLLASGRPDAPMPDRVWE
jgi:ADP-ribose pyrophosphatase YjhB (NUDIX family)